MRRIVDDVARVHQGARQKMVKKVILEGRRLAETKHLHTNPAFALQSPTPVHQHSHDSVSHVLFHQSEPPLCSWNQSSVKYRW